MLGNKNAWVRGIVSTNSVNVIPEKVSSLKNMDYWSIGTCHGDNIASNNNLIRPTYDLKEALTNK